MLTKQEKIEKIIKVLENRNLIIESTGFKKRIPQMSDERINILYAVISYYIQIEKDIYDKLMEGYLEILNSQLIHDGVKSIINEFGTIIDSLMKENIVDVDVVLEILSKVIRDNNLDDQVIDSHKKKYR